MAQAAQEPMAIAPLPNSRKVYVNGSRPDIRVPMREIAQSATADVPNPSGQRRYGDEINLALRWAISRQLYFLAVAGIAWPGEVIKTQTQGAARPWSTVQASLFVNF